MGQADPILTRLGAGPAVKKLVETSLLLSNSTDAQQRTHAYGFMQEALRELELDNHNNGSREDGSEQSTENEEPYSGEGQSTNDGGRPMQDMAKHQDQWNETDGQGMVVSGLPPYNGMDPTVAQELASKIKTKPKMNTDQVLREMDYIIETSLQNYHKHVIAPLREQLKRGNATIKIQREALKALTFQLKETSASNGTLSFDLGSLKRNAPTRFRETEIKIPGAFRGHIVSDGQISGTRSKDNLEKARMAISSEDKILSRNENPDIYT